MVRTTRRRAARHHTARRTARATAPHRALRRTAPRAVRGAPCAAPIKGECTRLDLISACIRP
ncbi:hypothetical protein Pa4123_89080 [Phytohabitans aurantiacus]|uniref:Uncharacterized protein n=1 Tax=Phytohabitans aurantiacus TaxID=3016789 RepID=A0ABQ5RAE3_9ACTN|nr:hypothetical protein Pa4123_89080 [Phytohabitans aurantiacus]